jgi:hypothetical protein
MEEIWLWKKEMQKKLSTARIALLYVLLAFKKFISETIGTVLKYLEQIWTKPVPV